MRPRVGNDQPHGTPGFGRGFVLHRNTPPPESPSAQAGGCSLLTSPPASVRDVLNVSRFETEAELAKE